METESQKKDYEISFLGGEESVKDTVLAQLHKQEGEILLEGPVERINLAYAIQKQTAAHFGYLHFRMEADKVPQLSEELRTQSGILRFLIITPPFVKNKPRAPRPKPETTPTGTITEPRKPEVAAPLSNEALEKKIEEILQQ